MHSPESQHQGHCIHVSGSGSCRSYASSSGHYQLFLKKAEKAGGASMKTVKKQNKKLTLEVSLKLSESMNGRRQQPPTYHEREYVFHII